MSTLAIVFGALLEVLGIGLAVGSVMHLGHLSPTALIPVGFGVALQVCGFLARNDKMRMHAMHAAALVGSIGCIASLGMSIRKLVVGEMDKPLAVYGQLAMGVLCGIFVALCVRSFIAARKARKRQEAGTPT